MAVSIVSSKTINGSTFFRNNPFDISFSVAGADASISFCNSTYAILPYTDTSTARVKASSGIPTLGAVGTLSVDAVMVDPQVVSTVTNPSYAGVDGVVADGSGILYFTVANQNRVFMMDLSGTITPFAGSGTAGDSDGPRLSAQFREPLSISYDGSGSFYVTDKYRLRKIAADGTVSTLAGSNVQGFVNGTGSAARFLWPNACAPQPSGDVFVTDSDSHCIRNVTQGGVVTTYAGIASTPGSGDGARIPSPTVTYQFHAVRAAVGGSLYDTSDGASTWSLSSTTLAFSTLYTSLYDPSTGLLLYGGPSNATYGGGIARQVAPDSNVVAPTASPALDTVYAFATDGSTYVVGGVKTSTNSPVYFSTNLGGTWTTNGSPGNNLLSACYAIDHGNGVWMAAGRGSNNGVTDSSSNVLRSTDGGQTWTRTSACPVREIYGIAYGGGRWIAVGANKSEAGYSNAAYSTDDGVTWTGMVTAGTGQRIAYGNGTWVIGYSNVLVNPIGYSTNGTSFSSASGVPTSFYNVESLRYNSTFGVWIASGSGGASNIVTSTTGTSWTAGTNTPSTYARSFLDISVSRTTLTGAQFSYPSGLALDTTSSTLYVADTYNNKIRAINGATVTTYAGTGADAPTTTGPRLTSILARPLGLTRDSAGTFFVSSFERNTLSAISNGTLRSLAGAYGVPGSTDGLASNARFNGPQGLTVVGSNVYICDFYNGILRKYTRYPELRPNTPRVPVGGTIIATSNYPITVNSRIDVSWTSVGGQLPLYKFEPFSNTFTANRCNGDTSDTLVYAPSVSTELIGYLTGATTPNVAFRAPNGASIAYTYPLTLAIQAVSNGLVVDDVSTTVTIGPGRIVYSPCNANLVFYRNEPSPAPVFSLVSSDVSALYSATSLPTGLGFTRTGSRSFALTGTPVTQTITSNYTILAFDTSSRTYSTQVSMVVNPERLLLDVSGSLLISNVRADTPIEPVTFTARFPPYTSALRSMLYTWSSPPPGGLRFYDPSGTALSGLSYSAVGLSADASFALTLAGTITTSQLRTYASNGTTSTTVTLTGARTFPLPSLSPSLPKTLTFRFGEVIFFDASTTSLFVGLQTPGSNFYYSAKTYFPVMDTSIASITVTDGFLPDGLDGSFNRTLQRFELSGTPTAPITYAFTLTATNGSGVSANLPVTLQVKTDVVRITPLSDVCSTFIQTRSLSSPKTGFYSYPIQFRVAADSTCNATLAASSLPDGVTLVQTSSNVYDLSGRPTLPTSFTTATLTASVAATGVTASTPFQYSVSAEQFFFPRDICDVSFDFIQNVPGTPIRVDVSTFSENSVIRFSGPSLPDAIQVTNTGIVEGTVRGSTSGTLTLAAYTAYTSGTKAYSYRVTPDQVLLQPSVYTTVTAPGKSVAIPITGYSLSALTVSNYRFQSAFPYGLSIDATSGLLSGTLASSLPTSTSFTLVGSAGSVDGTLVGTMTTTNLTVNRAQLLRNSYGTLPSTKTLYTYFSDDNGTTWSNRYSQSNSVYASTIGSNGSNLYLIPTSSSVLLRSTDGSGFTSLTYDDASNSPRATGIVNKPGTSTWWMVGTRDTGPSSRGTFLYTSSNDGQTWASSQITAASARDKNLVSSGQWSPYINGGAALAYKNGVLLFGGTQILRSTDEGQTWSTVTGGFTKEVGSFSVDHDTVWIATGSDTYETLSNTAWTGTTANTICYSIDAGLTWTYAANGFNMNGYGVVRSPNAWIAYGLCNVASSYSLNAMVSFDGANWSSLPIPSSPGPTSGTVRPDPLRMTVGFDETDWKIIGTTDTTLTLYSHPYSTPLTSGWTSNVITSQFAGFDSNTLISSYISELIDPGADVTTITFPFPNTGPTFISPAQSTFVVWQYMPVPEIVFSAPGATAYFVSSLPVGLTWDSVRHSVSGSCMRLGTQTFTVYAKNSGLTAFTVTMIVNVPRIVKKQSSAGAYTALVRDYTEVAAALNARDTRVNAPEALGSFASPYPPDVVTPSNCPC